MSMMIMTNHKNEGLAVFVTFAIIELDIKKKIMQNIRRFRSTKKNLNI